MPKLEESNLVLAQEELRMGNRYYLYRSQEEDARGRRKIGGVYILQKEIGRNPPENMKIVLEWTENTEDDESLIALD